MATDSERSVSPVHRSSSSSSFRSIKNWKDFVEIDPARSKVIKEQVNNTNFSVEAYICKFCNHEFTYFARNGPRTISKHLQKRHAQEIFNTNSSAVAAAAAAAAAVAATNGMMNDSMLNAATSNFASVMGTSAGDDNDPHSQEKGTSLTNGNTNAFNNDISTAANTSSINDGTSCSNENNSVANFNGNNDNVNTSPDSFVNNFNFRYYQPQNASLTASGLEFAIKVTTKQWKFHYNYNAEKTYQIKDDRQSSRFPSEVYECKYCNKEFIYCSRNGPGTLVKHMEKYHLSDVLNHDPTLAHHSEVLASQRKASDQRNIQLDDRNARGDINSSSVLDAAISDPVQSGSNGNQGNSFDRASGADVPLFNSSCVSNLEYLSRAAKSWKLHYTRNTAKTADVKLSEKEVPPKFQHEVYDCNYCGQSKLYISRNGPKTLTKHLEKAHKKELLATNPNDLIGTVSKRRLSADETDSVDRSDKKRSRSENAGGDGENEEAGAQDGYTKNKFHGDLISMLNENKHYIQVVRSKSFANLIRNMRPEFASALVEFESLYSSFMQILSNAAQAAESEKPAEIAAAVNETTNRENNGNEIIGNGEILNYDKEINNDSNTNNNETEKYQGQSSAQDGNVSQNSLKHGTVDKSYGQDVSNDSNVSSTKQDDTGEKFPGSGIQISQLEALPENIDSTLDRALLQSN